MVEANGAAFTEAVFQAGLESLLVDYTRWLDDGGFNSGDDEQEVVAEYFNQRKANKDG